MLRLLDHPNIIRLFETIEEGGNIYLIMELCEGGDLSKRCIGMNEQQIAVIMSKLLSAIAYCHDKGICHRDIK